MATKKACPVCGGAMVESGVVEGLGLIYMCDDDFCSSHGSEHDCPECGHPTAYVWIEAGSAEATNESATPSRGAQGTDSNQADAGHGHWERRCFDPLCTTA